RRLRPGACGARVGPFGHTAGRAFPRPHRAHTRCPAGSGRRARDASRPAPIPPRPRAGPRAGGRRPAARPGGARRRGRKDRAQAPPLGVTDCGEVLRHMVRHFGEWLGEAHGIRFELATTPFASVLRPDGTAMTDDEKWYFLDLFFDTEMHRQTPVEG